MQIPKYQECFMVIQPSQARTTLCGCSCLTLHTPMASAPHLTACHYAAPVPYTIVPLPYNIQGAMVTGYLIFQDSKNAALSVHE